MYLYISRHIILYDNMNIHQSNYVLMVVLGHGSCNVIYFMYDNLYTT